MVIIEENDLLHYGILRKSGRYPWGTGNNAEKRGRTFLDMVDDLQRRLGWDDAKIGKHFSLPDEKELTSTQLRQMRRIAKNEIKAAQIAQAYRLKNERGWSNVAIGQRMGIPESTVRSLLADGAADKINLLNSAADMFREQVGEYKYVDVGSGVESYMMGISKERKDTALAMLMDEGYKSYYVKVPQPGTGHETKMRVIAAPGTPYKEVFKNRDQIRGVAKISDDGGRSWYGIVDPLSVDPKRIAVRYNDEGGGVADGMIHVRPGVEDLSMGVSHYAQVRIKVGDAHYMKGMAVQSYDLPDGVDILFNTSKSDTGNQLDALKAIKDDPDNPFGSYIRRQIIVKDKNGIDRAVSAMNIVNEEGNWGGGLLNEKTGAPEPGWSKSIAAQVLSKQSPELARSQLNKTFETSQRELNEIMALTNSTVRKKLLGEYADGVDAAAVHLQAAALPRQRWQVILPIDSLKDTEIYAPNFRDGEKVAVIRYPHGGTFEIPVLTVNTRHAESRRVLGTSPRDAVGINSKVAEHLSGADFDGDTVLVIPNNQNRVRVTPALSQLKGFVPRGAYPPYDGMPTMDGGVYNAVTKSVDYQGRRPSTVRKTREMGEVSNLITDMTIKNASHDKIARAVKHSMVVIDAETHNLNYKQSAIDNGIRALKMEYQNPPGYGASTLISRANATKLIDERRDRRASEGGPINPVTGRREYVETGRSYVNSKGKVVKNKTRSKGLAVVDDAHELSSGTPMERLYAEHSNKLKGLANQARLQYLNTPRATWSQSAGRAYVNEVTTLNAKLEIAKRNRPLERQALVLAQAIIRQKRDANPNMDTETLNKITFQALEEQRRRTGAYKHRIEITPKEWEAIQAGAISDSRLSDILRNADIDMVRRLATPRTPRLMTGANVRRAQTMLAGGATRAQVADALGVSVSTLDEAMV